MPEYELLDELPEHAARPGRNDERVQLVTLSGEARAVSLDDFECLPQTLLTEDFSCEEGWLVPRQTWRGVLVGDLLDATDADAGQWVEFAAVDYRLTLPMREARTALVALTLNGAPLGHSHGGPFRLYVPGEACYTSIKWLDRIEVRDSPGSSSASRIARQRLTNRGSRQAGTT